jgi:type IV secretion system protein VirB1
MDALPPPPAICSEQLSKTAMAPIVRVESGGNPYAIGIVGGHLARQPRNREEAIATALELDRQGYNFSLGLGQVNLHNLAKYNLSYAQAFEPCPNLKAAAGIFNDCYDRAKDAYSNPYWPAVSCYYSGNFRRGFVPDFKGTSYVQRVAQAAESNASAPIAIIPDGVKPPASGASAGDASSKAPTPPAAPPVQAAVLFTDSPQPASPSSSTIVFPDQGGEAAK